jgi:hypothetical protein
VQKFDEFKELGSEAAVKVRTNIVWLRDDILKEMWFLVNGECGRSFTPSAQVML